MFKADLTDAEDLGKVQRRLVEDASISLLVNNAGMAAEGGLIGGDIAILQQMILLNVLAPTRLARAPQLAARGKGGIVNVASVLALAPALFGGTYSGTKAFLLNFSLALHKELAPHGAFSQAVLPGAALTEIWERSGMDPNSLPPEMLMSVDDLIDAALVGLDRGETVIIPPLPDDAEWERYSEARLAMAPRLSRREVSPHYRTDGRRADRRGPARAGRTDRCRAAAPAAGRGYPRPPGSRYGAGRSHRVARRMNHPAVAKDSPYLRRLGIWDAAAIVVGGVIGAGIFRTPATVAQRTDAGWQVLLLWAVGGLLTLAGVLCYAELGARRPQAGGTYVYLREAFGQLPAFLFGWTMALINYPGSVAAVATTFADYLSTALGLAPLWVKPLATGAVGFLVAVNLLGIGAGSRVQNLFTLLKLAAVSLVVVVGLVLARGQFGGVLASEAVAPVSAGTFIGALLPVLFAYGGFHYLNDLAGEVREPQRILPRALGLGMASVALCYVLINVAYLAGLGHAGLAASKAPAAEMMNSLFGPAGVTLIAIGIACSTFGYCNIAIAGGARVLQTMSADGMFFRAVARVDPRRRAPQVALLALGAWTIALIWSGSFNALLDYTTVGEWLSHAAGIATLFWYRRRFADQPSPYRVPGYPLLPLLFVGTVLAVIAATAIHAPGDAGMSLLIIAIGVPVYWAWRRRSAPRG